MVASVSAGLSKPTSPCLARCRPRAESAPPYADADVLVYFQADEDKNTAIAPKIAFVLALALACLFVLLLPLDVANRTTASGLDMEVLWQLAYMMIALFALGVIPFLIFYYEAEDPESRQYQCWTAVKYELVTLGVTLALLIVAWLLAGFAEVPIVSYTYTGTLADAYADASPPDAAVQKREELLTVSVTPITWIMALISFVGWFLFVLFGGIGMAALPMDLLVDYTTRPVSIDLQEYAKQKMILNTRANQLLEISKQLGPDAHRAEGRKGRTQFNKFKQAVYFLEKDWEKVKVAYKQRGGNPLRHVFFFCLGIASAILSTTWMLHIILYIFIEPPADQFLNNYFMKLDDAFALFGVMTYAIYVFYLLFCVVKGNMKFGLRFFCIPIHPVRHHRRRPPHPPHTHATLHRAPPPTRPPTTTTHSSLPSLLGQMRIGNTMMNSMLFNVLLLLTSVSVVQFCTRAFATYARLTAADMLFSVQVENLMFLNFFFRNGVFIYSFVCVTCCTIVYLSICPTDKRAKFDDDDDAPI